MRCLSCCLTLIAFLAGSCHSSTGNSGTDGQSGVSDSLAKKVMGVYTGNFNKGIISLDLNYISGKNVSGYDVHRGLRRNINGSVSENGGLLQFVLKEPGDNPFDGSFNFSLDTASMKIDGKWSPLDSTKVKPRKFLLSRRIDSLMEENTWSTETTNDTTLTFNANGSCDYAFYEHPGDSTSQLITISGSYEQIKDTFKIEWQKNTHTPAQSMRLVKKHIKVKGEDNNEYDVVRLEGLGMRFVILIGD